MTEPKDPKITVTFAPGCFDNFEGTQEELEALIKEITEMAESGELAERAVPVDIDDLLEEGDEEFAEAILRAESTSTRTLQ